jgi:hypothetical protein
MAVLYTLTPSFKVAVLSTLIHGFNTFPACISAKVLASVWNSFYIMIQFSINHINTNIKILFFKRHFIDFFFCITARTLVLLISLSPHVWDLPLQLSSPPKTSHCGSCNMSQCVPQYFPLSTHLHLQMFIAMSHWSGSRPLASLTPSILDAHPDSSQLSCCCSVSWRSCSFGTAGLALAWFPIIYKWYRCWGGTTQSPGSGLGGSCAGHCAQSPLSAPPGEVP